MKLDRERFLALALGGAALGLAACAHHGGASPTDERHQGHVSASPLDDPNCTGFDFAADGDLKCVAWKTKGVSAGYLPTDECVRWDDAGRCTGKEFVKKGASGQIGD